ncbi:FadR/GntR family transcriptional regulator [Herbaspirillum robiniae]|uniref:FadR/GntR family transcriptional regulator n=1 Tax=Herbaspirillum robiniae TaxID=2014887 RepID=UPI003D779145
MIESSAKGRAVVCISYTSQMPAPRLKNFHHQIVDAIGNSIVTGAYPEGSQLPTEDRLAETYGASRLIIREAMKSLAAKGLVSIRPRTGTHVLPRRQWNLFDPAVLAWHAVTPTDHKLLADLMELRQAIEPLAARLAAQRAEPSDLDSIRAAFSAMEKANNKSSYIESDLLFHGAVMKSCGNQFMVQLETALAAVWRTSFQASSDEWGPDAQALALHRSLLDAIVGKDPVSAEKAVFALINRAAMRIEKAIQS